ncbi:MAG: hypothetical protein ACRYFS_21655 [Janthinobacterium lividum]
MTNKRSTFFALMICLFLLMDVFAAASTPPPPPPTVVTVTDSFAPHGAYLRWEQFSTDLSASITNPPQSTTETTITGPTYQWNIVSQSPSSPIFAIIDSGNGNATLQSPTPSKSVCFIAGGGTYNVYVNCTITYTSTNNTTGATTPLSYSANPSLDVTFFVRVPVLVEETSARNIVDAAGNYYHIGNYNGPIWGFISNYSFELLDNQSPRQPYGNGVLQESFSSVSPPGFQPNGPGGGDAWNLNNDGSGSPTDSWTDSNFVYYMQDPGPINQNQFVYSFYQNWDCMEATPPYASPQLYVTFNNKGGHQFLPSINDTSLTPQMFVKVYGGYAIRSFPGDPYSN